LARAAVFLDRDGTINVRPAEHDYVRDPDQFAWLPEAVSGMVALARSGLPLIVVSNQRGVSRGLVSRRTLAAIEARIQDELRGHGAHVSGFYYCVHDLQDRCDCRKPEPGLLLTAARDLDLDLPMSWMVGDTEGDIEAGRRAGCRTVLISGEPHPWATTAATLQLASRLILGQTEDQALRGPGRPDLDG
jgi:histidinol-phosphate phosphatase family protein